MERLKKTGCLELRGSSSGNISSRIGIGFEKLDRGVFDPEKAYDKVEALGVSWVRIQSGWARTEKERGVYDFSWLDEIVDNLRRRNLEPWLCLCYGNSLYTPAAVGSFGSVGFPPIDTEEERQAWLNYVEATVKHFEGRITWYEVWNEPDLAYYSWKHEKTEAASPAKEYAHFCMDTADLIRSIDSSAKVIGFSIGNVNDLNYINTALREGIAEHIDALSFHVYRAASGRRPMAIDAIRALLERYAPHLKIIQGEAGSPSRSDGAGAMHECAWTPQRQMNYLLRGTLHDIGKDVMFSSYFSTMDMIEAHSGILSDKKSYLDYGYFGVLSADFDEDGIATGEYTPKPSYRALGTLARVFCGEWKPSVLPIHRVVKPSPRINGKDCNDMSIYTYVFEREDGSAALAYWNETNILTSPYEGTISFEYFGKSDVEIKLIDLTNGNVYEIPHPMLSRTEDGMISLTNIPLTDSPLLITFGDFII